MIRRPTVDAGLLEEFDFSGGVDLTGASTELPRGHMQNCVNLILDQSGGVSLRKGNAALDTVLAGTGTISVLGEGRFINAAGTEYRVAAYSDSSATGGLTAGATHFKYFGAGAWVEITQSVNEFTHNTAIRFCMAGDLLLIFNGVDRIAGWNGTDTIVYLGLDAPPLAANITYSATGITGKFLYMFVYKNGTYGFTSSGSPLVWALPTNQKVLVEIPIDAGIELGVTKVRIFRSVNSPTGVELPFSSYYFLAEVDYDGTPAVTYTDTTTDTTLVSHATFYSELESGPYDHDLPPDKPTRCISHKGRLFIVPDDSSNVYWSKPNEPAYFQPGDDMEIDPGVGSWLNQLSESENGILVHKDASTNIIETYGDSTNWRVRKISVHGCIAPHTLRMVQTMNGQMAAVRLSDDGVRLVDEQGDTLISENVNPILANLSLNVLASFTAAWIGRENLYVLMSPDYTLMVSGNAGIGASNPYTVVPIPTVGVQDDQMTGNEGASNIGIKSFFFHLRRPVQNVKGTFIGMACTFGSQCYNHVLDTITPNDENIYGVAFNDGSAIYKIWTGNQDYGETIPFSFQTRPISINKFMECRFNRIFYRVKSQDVYFDSMVSLDFGESVQIVPNLNCIVSATQLGFNCWKKAGPPLFDVLIAGDFTVGNHYFLYYLADTTSPATWNLVTQPSYISAAMNVPSGTNGFRMTLPGDQVAYNKGYRYYIVFHAGPLASAATYADFDSAGPLTWALRADGLDQTANFTAESSLTKPYAPPVDELEYAGSGIKNIEVRLSARFVGNYITLTNYGFADDPTLVFMGIGLEYKPRIRA